MLDDQTTPTDAAEPLGRLFRAREARLRLDDMEEAARRDLALCGLNGRTVDLALSLLERGIKSTVEEHRAAQALLRLARAPVQIEVANYYTGPDALTAERARDIAFDEGWYARLTGASRTCKARNENERRGWMAGWDQCDADMKAGQPVASNASASAS
ncbi:MAG: hypothetical protein JKP96_06595 [Oceanicaulis sp.]|jgi:ribosome modulation factor|nr:hypothetical protein [Oceanicaulis sp.]